MLLCALATLVRVSVVFIGVGSVCGFHAVALGNAVEFTSEKKGPGGEHD